MKRRTYGRDAGLTARMLLTGGLLGLLYVVFAVVLFNVLSVGLVPMLADRRRARVLPVLHLRQARPRAPPARRSSAARTRPRCTTWSSASARWPTCRSRRIAIIDTPVPNAFATGRSPEARRRRRHDRPLEPARAGRDRGRPRPRALAHRQPRRADHDPRELLRHARRDADPLRHVRRHVRRRRPRATTTARRSG